MCKEVPETMAVFLFQWLPQWFGFQTSLLSSQSREGYPSAAPASSVSFRSSPSALSVPDGQRLKESLQVTLLLVCACTGYYRSKQTWFFCMNMTLKRNNRNVISQKEFRYYAVIYHDKTSVILYIVLFSSLDVLAWCSGPAVSWFTSSTDTGTERHTFIGATFSLCPPERAELRRTFCSWWALLSGFSHFLASGRLV